MEKYSTIGRNLSEKMSFIERKWLRKLPLRNMLAGVTKVKLICHTLNQNKEIN